MKKGFRILLLSGLLFSSFLSGPLTAFAETEGSSSESEMTISSETENTVPNLTNGIEDGSVTDDGPTSSQLASESIDDWMPDKNLQQQIVNQLRISHPEITSLEQITKELLEGLDFYIQASSDGDVENLKGIEYAKSYSIIFSNVTITTTEALSNFIGGYLDNLEQFNWYGNAPFSQIDFAAVFQDWKYFNYSGEDWHYVMTGTLEQVSATSLDIPVSSYSEDGELKISLNEIGLWSSLDTKLLTDPDVLDGVDDLLIKDEQGDILATYRYSSFDVATQSLIFKFEAQESKTVEELSGRQLFYSLTTVRDSSVPSFNFEASGSNFSDFIQSAFHFQIYFSEVNFLTPALPAADVMVKYVDEAGNSIASQETVTGNVGDTYTAVQKTIDGYTFKEVQGNPTGTLTDEPQTVTYVYTKDTIKAADVVVKYVDEAGNSIADQETVTGNVGDTYTAVQKTIDGYTFKEVQGNPTGTLTDEPQTVTYVYTKDKVSPSKNTNDTTPKTKKSNQSLPKTSAVDNKVLTVMGILMLVMMIPFSWYRKRSQK